MNIHALLTRAKEMTRCKTVTVRGIKWGDKWKIVVLASGSQIYKNMLNREELYELLDALSEQCEATIGYGYADRDFEITFCCQNKAKGR